MSALYKWKKICIALPFLLTFFLCLDVRQAEASQTDAGEMQEAVTDIWADENCAARYQETEGGEWIYSDFLTACGSVYSGGTVQLGQDAYANGILRVASGRAITVTSYDPEHPCVYSVQIDRHPWLVLVDAGGSLCLQDVIVDGGSENGLTAGCPLIAVNGGTLRLNSGAVIRNNDNQNPVRIDGSTPGGGGVVLLGTGSVTMEDGAAIQNCRAYYGGGAAIIGSGDQSFIMNGGVIEGCGAARGGGVYINRGNFVMNGGEIRDNSAGKREGVDDVTEFNGQGGGMIIAGDSANVKICGGSVLHNSAESVAGGIRCERGMLWIAGGSVTQNHAGTHAGGILTNPLFTSIRLSVGAYIDENTEEENEPGRNTNLYLDGNEVESGDGSDITKPFEFECLEIRAGMSPIHISRWVNPDQNNPVRVVGYPAEEHVLTEQTLALFLSDNADYAVILTPGEGEYENQMVLAITSLQVELEQEEISLELPGDGDGVVQSYYGVGAEGKQGDGAKASGRLTAQIRHLPYGAVHKGLIWTSSDESVAIVDDQGNVTATGEGQATITVTLRGNENIPAYTDVCSVKVSAGAGDIPGEEPSEDNTPERPEENTKVPDKPEEDMKVPNEPDNSGEDMKASDKPDKLDNQGKDMNVPDRPDKPEETVSPAGPEASGSSGTTLIRDILKTGDASCIWMLIHIGSAMGLLCVWIRKKMKISCSPGKKNVYFMNKDRLYSNSNSSKGK